MNSLMNNTQLQNTIRIARSSLLLLIVCCCVVIGNNAFAQYPNSSPYSLLTGNDSRPYTSPQYHADINATDSGGGTWGKILNMNVRIEGSGAIFSITSKKGPFYNTNSISIRSGSQTGPVVAAGKIPPGSEAATLRLDLGTVASFPHRLFASITNNIGYAWVGPVQISKNETATSNPVPWNEAQPTPTGPQRPIINESPERTTINSAVNIAVTAGQTQNNDMVRIQCTASSSDNTPSTPYRSGWMHSGEILNVPLTFHSTGTQVIFCNTLDSYGATSSLTQRTITVTPGQTFSTSPAPPRRNFSEPTPPPRRDLYSTPPTPAPRRDLSRPVPAQRRITSTPAPLVEVPDQGSVNAPISITLIAGHDPQNRDLVRIGCTADNSNRTAADPYLSDWLPPEGKAKGMFTFNSPGEKNIYCTSLSRQEVASPSTRKTINIQFANQAPGQPKISEYPSAAQLGKATYISVTAGADPDGDQVKVQCSATDSSITGNAPYSSDWIAPLSTVTATLAFYTSGNKEISCVTIDSKDAQSDKATRKIHVHNSQYNPGYTPDHNFNKKSDSSGPKDCGCQQDGSTSSYPMKNSTQQGSGSITFNQPYIPEYPSRQSVFQAPQPQPDLKGRVVYRSNGSPAQNAMVKILDTMSGRAYTATTDYNGEFKLNFIQKNITGQIQATKGADTSSIREVQIKANKPTVINLTIMDRAPAQPTTHQQWSPQPRWPAQQAAPAQPTQPQWSPQSQRPAKQAAPPVHNSVWQFN